MYIRYIHKLCDLHLQAEDFTGITLILGHFLVIAYGLWQRICADKVVFLIALHPHKGRLILDSHYRLSPHLYPVALHVTSLS